MRDRIKILINHSKMESISLNGEVNSNMKQVTVDTRRTRNKQKRINVNPEKIE